MDLDVRPHKKRRFFADESSDSDDWQQDGGKPSKKTSSVTAEETSTQAQLESHDTTVFKTSALTDIVGPVSEAIVAQLQRIYGTNLERAVNAYFDGSWKNQVSQTPGSHSASRPLQPRTIFSKSSPPVNDGPPTQDSSPSPQTSTESVPPIRYLGAFGVAAWTTKSGSNVLKSGDHVRIKRVRQRGPEQGRNGRGRQANRKTEDVIVRICNSRDDEIGRLEKDAAIWISTLLDQDVCSFTAQCIYAPEPIRVNDTVYIQVRSAIRSRAFEGKGLLKPFDNNRQTGFFEVAETNEERDLRLRQFSLAKLFTEINLEPSKTNQTTAKHKRDGMLQAADIAAHYEQSDAEKTSKRATSNEGLTNSGNESEAVESENGVQGDDENDAENEEGEKLEQDQLDSLYRKAQTFDFDMPQARPPDTFNMDLRKYQAQALHWMLSKETMEQNSHRQQSMHPLWEEYMFPVKDMDGQDLQPHERGGPEYFYVNPYSGELSLDFPVQEETCRGGILADEMGLGKTIEMLSLIHSHPAQEQQAPNTDQDVTPDAVASLLRQPSASAGLTKALSTTLVVAPMSLLAQWASEAERASETGTLSVFIYYDSEKNVDLRAFCRTHPNDVPKVIVTSYGTVLSEFNTLTKRENGDRNSSSGLFGVEYWRIILDEAHTIKNRQSKTAKACYELAAQNRWVLTGTPIVNRLEDLFSLVRFLRVEPWNNFSVWKTFITTPFEKGEFVRALDVVQTVLEPLVLRRTKDMKTPSGEALVPLPPRTITVHKVELSEPERDVYEHIFLRAKRTFTANVEAGTLMKSYTTIFTQILRLRQSCCHPSLTRNRAIVDDEEDAAAAVDVANGLADDMDLDALIARFESNEDDQDASKYGAHVLKQIQDEMDMECPICSEEPMDEQAVTGCWHSACKKCLLDYIEHQISKGDLPRCFNCREPINARDVFEVIKHDDDDEDGVSDSSPVNPKGSPSIDDDLYNSSQPAALTTPTNPTKKKPRITLRRVNQLSSAKLSNLLTLLKAQRKAFPTAKSVIFSQFTSFLDILTPALASHNIKHLRFDGSLSQKERTRVLADFAASDKFTVLLLSLRAGGVGLNLTCAQKVYMMDPWWSWAVEAQAIDRVHRMGQERPVEVVRFVVEESIEEKMLKVQERKKFIASSLGMMNAEEKKMQRIEDIRELLS